jgi:hypothetical protein
MSSVKQELDRKDVHIAWVRPSSAGGKCASRFGIAAVVQCKYIDIVAAIVGALFGIILKG